MASWTAAAPAATIVYDVSTSERRSPGIAATAPTCWHATLAATIIYGEP